METQSRWRLKLIGRPELSYCGAQIDGLPKKCFAIAAKLILDHGELSSSRDSMALFLWSDADAEQRRASLRTLIKRIRSALLEYPEAPFRFDDETILLDTSRFTSDLQDLAARLRSDRLADVVDAARLLDGNLLEACESGCEDYRRWLIERRERLAGAFARVATKALKRGELTAQPRLREALELKVLAARPIDVQSHSAILKLQHARPGAAGGRNGGAGRLFDALPTLSNALDDSLDSFESGAATHRKP